MKALILVDIQKDFVPGGSLAVKDGDAVVFVANRLMAARRIDLIVATQDWHPWNHGSFASNHPGKKAGDIITLGGLSQVLWPDHCVQDSSGAEWADGLDAQRINQVIQKGTDAMIDSYSGFFDNGHRKATGLGDFLNKGRIKEVFVLGLATDYCVKYTALDSIKLGFRTTVIEDGCRGVNLKPDDASTALKEVRESGGYILNSNEVLVTCS